MRHIEEAFYGLAGYLELATILILEVCKFKRVNSVFNRLD